MVSWSERIQQASDEITRHAADPLRATVEATVRGMDEISTHALLDLIGLPHSTGNARRISKTMRDLGYVPIKSRRLMPGGYRDTVTRGWARPVRENVLKKPERQVSDRGLVPRQASQRGPLEKREVQQ
jgi:hypothetical protein